MHTVARGDKKTNSIGNRGLKEGIIEKHNEGRKSMLYQYYVFALKNHRAWMVTGDFGIKEYETLSSRN